MRKSRLKREDRRHRNERHKRRLRLRFGWYFDMIEFGRPDPFIPYYKWDNITQDHFGMERDYSAVIYRIRDQVTRRENPCCKLRKRSYL